nr:PREDICTED: CTP synthase-like [Bemisia tabaci]
MKYILVTGGVISGVGKGVVSSSFGAILRACGLHVTAIKIDPYMNIDAGTFSPYEHGEVFVLDDGGEVDIDLGNYERFLDITLNSDNSITTGKINQQVIAKERKGEYLGKTVQIVPHMSNAIIDWVEDVASRPIKSDGDDDDTPPSVPDVCIVELGGTVGDIEGRPYTEAFRPFSRKHHDSFCVAHVSYVPQPASTKEHKTRPTRQSVKELQDCGLLPDLLVCRSENPIPLPVKEKISSFCNVGLDEVICLHDQSSIYYVPLVLRDQGILEYFQKRLCLEYKVSLSTNVLSSWEALTKKLETVRREVNIVLVGKYIKLHDAYASVIKALQHASLKANYKLNLKFVNAENLEVDAEKTNPDLFHESWMTVCNSDGVIVPGGFGKRGMEGKIAVIKWCRTLKKPFLGICLGLHAAVIEFARNVLGHKDANSTEMDPECKDPVISDMPGHTNIDMGGTMRLGRQTTVFSKEHMDYSVVRKLYGNRKEIKERHRHRYEVNQKYLQELESNGLYFVGTDVDGLRMEILELDTDKHPYFIATQFHPEYLSRPMKPSPPFLGFILAATNNLESYLKYGLNQLS